MKGLAECDRKSTGDLCASAFSSQWPPKWKFALPALCKCISGDQEASPPAHQGHSRNLRRMRNFLVTEAGAVRGLLYQTGLIPDADIFWVFFFHVFSLEPSSKREAARAGGGGEGKKRGRWTCYFPSWVRKGGGGSAAKGPTFDFVGRR